MRRIACPRLVGRTLMRGLPSMLVLTALTPVAVAAQSPTIGGYAPGGPAIVDGTAPASQTTGLEVSANPPAKENHKLQGKPTRSDTEQGSTLTSARPSRADLEGAILPFTGLQIGMMLIAGLVLLGLGLSLRRSSTQARPFDDSRPSPHPGNSEVQPTLGPRGGP